jgi:putative tryptophan/tyrosine transport system substrate-binding protein
MMVTDVLTILNRKRVIDYAAEHRLPAIFEFAQFAHQGGLLAYGPNQTDIYDRTAKLTDRILKGAKPADLPLELPTRFDLAVNLKTAKMLGLDIPQSILLQATDVIGKGPDRPAALSVAGLKARPVR